MKISDVIVIGGASVTLDPVSAPQRVNKSEFVAAFLQNVGKISVTGKLLFGGAAQ